MIRNLKNGDISFQKSSSVNITITQDVLTGNDTVNTLIEKVVNEKTDRLKDKFILVDSISPIALGSSTAQMYRAKENGLDASYFYVPQNDRKYLLITNLSPSNSSTDFLTSEDIIYSLEFLP